MFFEKTFSAEHSPVRLSEKKGASMTIQISVLAFVEIPT